jgi:hypothetical protein
MFSRSLVVLLAAVAPGADAPKPPAAAPALKVTAVKLGNAYRTNEALAEETYSGKDVEVTGTVLRITKSKQPSLHRAGGTDYAVVLVSDPAARAKLPVVCFFPGTERKQLVDLRPGQQATIRGRCLDRMVWSVKPGHGHDDDISEVWVAECKLLPAARPK